MHCPNSFVVSQEYYLRFKSRRECLSYQSPTPKQPPSTPRKIKRSQLYYANHGDPLNSCFAPDRTKALAHHDNLYFKVFPAQTGLGLEHPGTDRRLLF